METRPTFATMIEKLRRRKWTEECPQQQYDTFTKKNSHSIAVVKLNWLTGEVRIRRYRFGRT